MGSKDNKGFPTKLDMQATLNELKGSYYNKNKTLCHECIITDNMNEKHKVLLLKDAPSPQFLNTQQTFSLYAYEGTYNDKQTGQMRNYTGYSGFWVANPQSQRQNAPPQQQSRPQNRPQAFQGGPGQEIPPPKDEIALYRSYALNAAVVLCSKGLIEKDMIYSEADDFLNYIFNSKPQTFEEKYDIPSDDAYEEIPI